MEAWYESETQRRSAFWVDMTQIYFLLIARKVWQHPLDEKMKKEWDILKQVVKINRYYLLEGNDNKCEYESIEKFVLKGERDEDFADPAWGSGLYS